MNRDNANVIHPNCIVSRWVQCLRSPLPSHIVCCCSASLCSQCWGKSHDWQKYRAPGLLLQMAVTFRLLARPDMSSYASFFMIATLQQDVYIKWRTGLIFLIYQAGIIWRFASLLPTQYLWIGFKLPQNVFSNYGIGVAPTQYNRENLRYVLKIKIYWYYWFI